MPEDFHVGMSGKLHQYKNVGIACVSTLTRKHNGCVLSADMLKLIRKRIFSGNSSTDQAKIYAICIYLLINNKLEHVKRLIICYDEDFVHVKAYLLILLGKELQFEIINIRDLRRMFQKNVKSLADSYANHYRKRGLKKNKWDVGVNLNVVEITFTDVKGYWEKLEQKV